MKTCSRCLETKPLTDFYTIGRGDGSHRSQCKPCSKELRDRAKMMARESGYVSTTEPCAACYRKDICRDSPIECAAFQFWVDESVVIPGWIGMRDRVAA